MQDIIEKFVSTISIKLGIFFVYLTRAHDNLTKKKQILLEISKFFPSYFVVVNSGRTMAESVNFNFSEHRKLHNKNDDKVVVSRGSQILKILNFQCSIFL